METENQTLVGGKARRSAKSHFFGQHSIEGSILQNRSVLFGAFLLAATFIALVMVFSIFLLVVVLFVVTNGAVTPPNINPYFKILDLQGHRGCRGLLPENSIPAFLKALEYPYVSTLELDMVISKDGQVVVSHDPFLNHYICHGPNNETLTEITEKDFVLYQMDYSEIKKCDCGSWGNPNFPQQVPMHTVKPLLKDVFEIVESTLKQKNMPLVYYNVETKSKPTGDDKYHPKPAEFVRIVYDLIKSYNLLPRITLQSFDVRTLQEMRKLDPSVKLSLLVEHLNTTVPFNFHDKLNELGFLPDIYSPKYVLMTAEMVQYCKENHVKVVPWTVNESQDMIHIRDTYNVSGIITDYPDRANVLF